jgi:hypothetical protein
MVIMTKKKKRLADQSTVANPYTAMPLDLFTQARQRLMVNEPMRAWASTMPGASALSLGEVQVLDSVGLNTSPWAGAPSRDPLAQSIADYMALLDTSLSTREVAKYLKVDTSRVRQRLRERSLFGIEYDGERRLPKFQFEYGQVIPGLSHVLPAIPADLNPLDIAEWFLSPHPDLDVGELEDVTVSPRQWLLSGRPVATVVALAKGLQ